MRAPTPIRGRRAGSRPATGSRAVGVGLASCLGLGLGLATALAPAMAAGVPVSLDATPASPAPGAAVTHDGAARCDLDPALPEEATDPAACVRLTPVPRGAADAGAGGTALGAGTSGAAADAPRDAVETRPAGAGLDPSTRPAEGTGATGWIGSDVGAAAFIGGLAMLGLIAAADQRRLLAERHRG